MHRRNAITSASHETGIFGFPRSAREPVSRGTPTSGVSASEVLSPRSVKCSRAVGAEIAPFPPSTHTDRLRAERCPQGCAHRWTNP